MDPDFWRTQRVVLTGHTGFKGSWLTLWLHRLGANVRGISLPEAPSEPSMFGRLSLSELCDHQACDIRDGDSVTRLVREFRPTIVLHMAAQALVRRSYREPISTFATNAMGTANVLEACRDVAGLKAVVVVTTDKCYENREWVYPYREVDALGGHDPYSASKAAAEIVTSSYRRSFFHEGETAVASARAGNVIGGGDWSEDRLIVDAAKAFGASREVIIRNTRAVRPWQHVLEPLSGYLTLARMLFERGRAVSPAFNFGPPAEQVLSVGEVVEAFTRAWGDGAKWRHDPPPAAPHEAGLLMLDPSLAMRELHWSPRWRMAATIEATVSWYKAFYAGASGADLRRLTNAQIDAYGRA
jgi:CDP-glucose 4,6-dehydratase